MSEAKAIEEEKTQDEAPQEEVVVKKSKKTPLKLVVDPKRRELELKRTFYKKTRF